MTSREALERHVDDLAGKHDGRDFADAIRVYAATLDEPGRDELKRVLLDRAADFDQAIMDRVDARGWFRRQWDRVAPR